MTTASLHSEWLSLIDISGPFLAEPVLKHVFPQGLDDIDAAKRRTLRQAYDEWREAQELGESDLPALHKAWIDLVLRLGLELDEDGKGDVFKTLAELPETLRCDLPEREVVLRPDFAVVNDQHGNEPMMLVSTYDPDVPLDEPLKANGWPASPAERMVELCPAAGVRLGLVTNGERWMFVDAPVGAVTSFASWYANLWSQEPKTLQAFVNLLGVRRFFVDRSEQLPALLDESLKFQDEVTDALGEQVRRAVEVLVQSLDRANVDRNYALLEGVEPAELYEAALTVMMRIVFLLSAEERGLLLMGDECYEANYAVSTLRLQLRAETEEILERRWDAWSRLLAVFRAIYGGIDHDGLRLPALGGSLFDPDRFPFLEGRSRGSNWKSHLAIPLPIDNRTVLLLLDAVQLFQGRILSYEGLDVEQIGYVYEGLLERTVVRAKEVTLDLDATKSAKKPWVTLEELEAAAAKGADRLSSLLIERTGSSASRVANDLTKTVEEDDADKLLTACHGSQKLRDRIRPYFHLLQTDRWGYPLVYPVGTFMVTTGADRRETGTHYTPKSLTEAIVKETLEPLVYIGPAEGKRRDEWQLKSPEKLLDLKVCDPAMGSGAFLVQVCRWLSECLVEAWDQAEAAGDAVTAEGVVVEKTNGYEPLRSDPKDRLLTAQRLIAERCLYGVDANPLAVELAKLAIWLVTLAKGRPFAFLNHNLRSGDALLGIQELDQLAYLEMKPGKGSAKKLFAADIDKAVAEAVALRFQIRSRPIVDIRDVEVMANFDEQARAKLRLPQLIADGLIGEVLAGGENVDATSLSIEAGDAMTGHANAGTLLRQRALRGLSRDLPEGKPPRRPFHWPLEFPEVFLRSDGGFDAFVGNPPFAGGQMLSGMFGTAYQAFLVNHRTLGDRSSVDLVVYFFLQAYRLLRRTGCMGLIGRRSISEGKNREAGLGQLLAAGAVIYNVTTNIRWPGKASVVVHMVHIGKSEWIGPKMLNGKEADILSADLSDQEFWEARKLNENLRKAFQGSILLGGGFRVDEVTAREWINADASYKEVLFPFIGGSEVNKDPYARPSGRVINFFDWSESEAKEFPLTYEKLQREVLPRRLKQKNEAAKKKWWMHYRFGFDLYHAIGHGASYRSHPENWKNEQLERVIVIPTSVTKYAAFTFVPSSYVYSHKLCVIADERLTLFCMLSSDVHTIWAWAQKTSFGGDLYSLAYAHGNIFETFPFPVGFMESGDERLEREGAEFFEKRRKYMEAKNKGLTKFYNQFHDRRLSNEEMVDLRASQKRINEAVVAAYGWDDIDLDCGFHEVGYLPDGRNTRFTVCEEARIKLLRRLSKLNKERWHQQDNSAAERSGEDKEYDSAPEDGDLFAEQDEIE